MEGLVLRSGKSVFICQKLIIKALKSKRKILVIRKVGNSLRESCWKLFKSVLSDWKIYNYCSFRESSYEIEFPNGSSIIMKGLDDSEKIKSIVGITDIWIEECTELNEEDFDQLNLRLRSNAENNQIFCSFNPVSKANYVYKRWFSEGDNEAFILKTTYKDNKFLPEDYIKQLESMINTNPTYYKIYALGIFCSLDKLVYNNWKVEEFDNTKLSGTLCVGLDFGYVADPTALIASIVDEKNKTIYVFDEAYQKGLTNDVIAQLITNHGFAKSHIIADSAEQKSIEEIRKLGISRIKPSVKGPDSIMNGIQYIQQYTMIIHPRCINIINELENYSFQKDKQTNEYINKPIDSFNHLLDALRYSIQIVWKPNKLKSMSKDKLGL